METLREYLLEAKGLNDFNGSINHLARSLVMRTHPRKQVILNGLIGVALGAYSMNDKRITALTHETIDRYSELL